MESIHDLANYFIPNDETEDDLYLLLIDNMLDSKFKHDNKTDNEDEEKSIGSEFKIILKFMLEGVKLRKLYKENELSEEKLSEYISLNQNMLMGLLGMMLSKLNKIQNDKFINEIDFAYDKQQSVQKEYKLQQKLLNWSKVYIDLLNQYKKLQDESEEARRFYHFHLQNNITNY